MIYKNQRLFSLACSKAQKIRKKAPTKKRQSPAIASIAKQNFTSSYSKHITIDSSEACPEFTEGDSIFRISPSSQTPLLVLLIVLLFITIYAKHHYYGSPWSCMERPSHGHADGNIHISLNQHQCYHFFHRTRHKPPGQPTSLPPSQPTDQPTGQPSSFPSSQPLAQPMYQTIMQPTSLPLSQPIDQHTGQPSSLLTDRPTNQPTAPLPTSQPTHPQTGHPTSSPTAQPDDQPTNQPKAPLPTSRPTVQPTGQPTSFPASQPEDQPINQPTAPFPTSQPTVQPTGQPTSFPTDPPIDQPTDPPTCLPTSQPTNQPTGQPSSADQPTYQPTTQPTSLPTSQLTYQPTGQPSSLATVPSCSVHNTDAKQSSRLIATSSTSDSSEHLVIPYQTADASSGASAFSRRTSLKSVKEGNATRLFPLLSFRCTVTSGLVYSILYLLTLSPDGVAVCLHNNNNIRRTSLKSDKEGDTACSFLLSTWEFIPRLSPTAGPVCSLLDTLSNNKYSHMPSVSEGSALRPHYSFMTSPEPTFFIPSVSEGSAIRPHHFFITSPEPTFFIPSVSEGSAIRLLYYTSSIPHPAWTLDACRQEGRPSLQLCVHVLASCSVPSCSVHNTEAIQYTRLITTASTSVRSEHLDIIYQTADASVYLDALHQTPDARGQEGWPTLHALILLDRLYSFFSTFLYLHDCFTYDLTLLDTRRPRHHRHGDPPRSSIDITVPHALLLLRVSTALHYDKRVAFS